MNASQIVTLNDGAETEAFRRLVFLLCEQREEQAMSLFYRKFESDEMVGKLTQESTFLLIYPFVVHEANSEE